MDAAFPVFFAAHEVTPGESREAHAPLSILDVFVLDDGAEAAEVAVGVDPQGTLALHAVGTLAGSAALAFNEMARGVPRGIRAKALWLFAFDMWQALPDAPGVNDPIELHGTLFGPFPRADGRVLAQEGHIVATRADALAGLVDGTRRAFVFASDALGAMARCAHVMVPADREQAIAAGEGLVLMYPLGGAVMDLEDAANELIVAALYYELLTALECEHPPTHGEPLPVPDRAALVAALEAEGFEIDGDEAVRRDPTRFMGGLFGGRDRREVPPEGTIEGYAGRAAAALATLSDWPSTRSRALFGRVSDDGRQRVAGVGARAAIPSRAVTGTGTWQPPPPAVIPPAHAPIKRASRSDWMRDFDRASGPPGPAPRAESRPRAAPKPAAPTGGKTAKKPDWMKDFES